MTPCIRVHAMCSSHLLHATPSPFSCSQASLPQKPRSCEDNERFLRALQVRLPDTVTSQPWIKLLNDPPSFLSLPRLAQVMGDLYASAVSTTVLILKEIPLRPKEFDGALALFGEMKDGVDEAAVRTALARYGDIQSCALKHSPPVVYFVEHASAVKAASSVGAASILGDCPCAGLGFCGASLLYNERSYDGREGEPTRADDTGRGWCSFEVAVSGELIARLSAYPKMTEVLEKLPPKVLLLASNRPTQPMVMTETGGLDQRLERNMTRIQSATFTGKADRETVPLLYRDYVEQLVGVLQKTLVMEHRSNTRASLPTMPTVSTPPHAPLRFAPGQLLLLLPDVQGRLAGGEGATQLVVTEEQCARVVLGGAEPLELTLDDFSLAVLPWQPLKDVRTATNETSALLQSLKEFEKQADADKRSRSLSDALETLDADHANGMIGLGERVETLMAEVWFILEAAGAMENDTRQSFGTESVTTLSAAALEVASAVRQVTPGGDPARFVRDMRGIVASLSPEALAARALKLIGRGSLRYAGGQAMTVRRDGEWVDAFVGEDGELYDTLGEPIRVVLHPWNHAPRELPYADFERLRAWHIDVMNMEHSHIVCALSGRPLHALHECVPIAVTGRDASGCPLETICCPKSLSTWLCGLHAQLCGGGAMDSKVAACAVLTAGPAAGKTWLMSQLIMHSLSLSSELIPILIRVELLQKLLLEHPSSFEGSWNWVDAYLRLKSKANEELPYYRMLRQAMMARRAVLLLDGLDEGGAARDRIERHVIEV